MNILGKVLDSNIIPRLDLSRSLPQASRHWKFYHKQSSSVMSGDLLPHSAIAKCMLPESLPLLKKCPRRHY